jgi:hypothetical protein
MTERPQSPYSLCNARGRIRIWGGEDDPDGNPDGDPVGGGEELTPEQKRIKELEDKNKELDTKAKAAEKAAKDNEKALKDKEREGMEDHDKLVADHEDLQQNYEKLLKFVETSFIDNAITKMSAAKQKDGSPKYEWHEATAVRTFVDARKDEIKLDMDTGEVDGLDAILADIAKSHPWMLVSKEERDGSYVPPDNNGTGNHPRGGSQRQRVTDDKALASKYKFNHLVVGGTPR